jgi:sugar phosphate isomerase/epimerase
MTLQLGRPVAAEQKTSPDSIAPDGTSLPGRNRHLLRRRWWVTGLVALIAVGASAVAALPKAVHSGPDSVCGEDALQARALADLVSYASWLDRNGVRGFVGEVGWPAGPDSERWNALADTWYRAADKLGLPVTAWAAARWPADYRMGAYSASANTLDTAGPQATVLQAHRGTRDLLRGVVLAGGSFGSADVNDAFHAGAPGRYGYDYSYENAASWDYLAARGVRLVRLTFAWERLQPMPNGPLDHDAVARLSTAVENARRTGIAVVLDLHGYGTYAAAPAVGGTTPRRLVLGSPELPAASLADFWSRLVAETKGNPAIYGYDVLNEPTSLAARGDDGAALWEQISQLAVQAIRRAGGTGAVLVSSYGETAPGAWGRMHPKPWINDPLNHVRYDAHVYFDADNSGHYADRYDVELSRVAADQDGCVELPRLGRRR